METLIMILTKIDNLLFLPDRKFTHICLWLTALMVLPWAGPLWTDQAAGQDPIYEMCQAQTERPGPWCYQETVEDRNQPELCENILKYWPKADGVHGWCYYQLALKNKKCSLCDKIHKGDIKRMCRLDACK